MVIAMIVGVGSSFEASPEYQAGPFQDQVSHRNFEQKWLEAEEFERNTYERYAKSHKVDYGGNHPFEILERRRLKTNHNGTDGNTHYEVRERELTPWSPTSIYKPIRMHFDTVYLDSMPEKYQQKINVIKYEILPKVKEVWGQALQVYQAEGNIIVKNSGCPHSDASQKTVGVPNTDLVIFVATNFESICVNSKALAAARSCQADQYDRPTIGSLIICLDRFNGVEQSSKDGLTRTILHEISHILGMRAADYPFFYDPETGLPRTPRPLEKRGVTCVDGNMVRIAPPSTNTLKTGYTNRGKLFYEVVTPTVRQVARNQFGCQQMGGARLENQPTNDGNCFGSHWEARLFASDVVAAIKIPTMQFMTPLTLALFEDSGWYRSDFSTAMITPFGHGKGCDFVYQDCIVDGKIPEWGKGIFCNDLSGPYMEQHCDLNHQYITRCDLVDFKDYPGSDPPDRSHQYFPGNPVSVQIIIIY